MEPDDENFVTLGQFMRHAENYTPREAYSAQIVVRDLATGRQVPALDAVLEVSTDGTLTMRVEVDLTP